MNAINGTVNVSTFPRHNVIVSVISEQERAALEKTGANESDIKLAVLVRDELTVCFCSKREDLPTALEIHLFRKTHNQNTVEAAQLIDAITKCNSVFLEEEYDQPSSAGCEATTVAKAIRWAIRKTP